MSYASLGFVGGPGVPYVLGTLAPITIDNLGRISVGSSALPAGAATAANQVLEIAALGLLATEATLVTRATEATLLAVLAALGPLASSTSTSTPAPIPVSVVNVTLLAAGPTRRGATIVNKSLVSTLYLKCGATATTSSFTVILEPGPAGTTRRSYYEVPFHYTGIVDGIWDLADAAGSAVVTEFLP